MAPWDVLVVGGGTAGITVASRLLRNRNFRRKKPRIAIIDPSHYHFYQPLWTLAGAGVLPKEVTRRAQSELIPTGAEWIPEAVASFSPSNNEVVLQTGETLPYRSLVVCPGLDLLWDKVPGLREALGKGGVCSNYSYATVDSTWRFLQEFKGGRAVFTHPTTPIKCGGAPQKIMYLAEEHFARRGIRANAELLFVSGQAALFPVKKYADLLAKVIAKKKIEVRLGQDLVDVNGADKKLRFKNLSDGVVQELSYDFLHVTPPMGPPEFVAKSELAGGGGWVEVNQASLQSTKFSNVFALGDVTNLPTSKTGAAIRKQAPVVVSNLLAYLDSQPLPAEYDGYTSCPLVTGYGKLILAEFGYGGKLLESFPFDQGKERLSMYLLKKFGLPLLYWQGMMKGRA